MRPARTQNLPALRAEPLPADEVLRREVWSFGLYRVLEAALLALIFLGPGDLFGTAQHPHLGRAVALVYLPATLILLLWARTGDRLAWQVMVGTVIDIVVAALAIHAMPHAGPGVAMLLLFNIGAAALMLPLTYGMVAALLGAMALIGEFAWSDAFDGGGSGLLAERVMFAVSYGAFALLTWGLGRRMRAQAALAARRGAEVADLSALNELIIRRMRTGVLLVDAQRRVRMANEAALLLLGHAGQDMREPDLADLAPVLAERLDEWRHNNDSEQAPLVLGEDPQEVLPRFVHLMATSHSTLVFLDDASQVSRRAESLTLAAMGRFSASLAHEIRNPLAAISYATQLLEESREIGDADRRLLQIVHQQCMRTNAIVESVLGLARRERAQPEQVDLVGLVRAFIADYRQTCPEENASIRQGGQLPEVPAMVDPRHLHQVLTSLANNAVRHGHQPGEPARITLHVDVLEGRPVIDITDRGPGIPDAVSHQLFRPFFTTSEQGTGLGLYIAHELCRANDGRLEYVSVPGGGACFRITLRGGSVMLG